MTVGEVLPMPGHFVAEGQQLRLLQLMNTFQDLAFGVGAFERQVEVMQQPAEQASIQQAQGLPRLGGPQLLGGSGNIVGQRLGAQFQTE
jgi:hypothetical protein